MNIAIIRVFNGFCRIFRFKHLLKYIVPVDFQSHDE